MQEKACFIKLNSLVTSLTLDMILGCFSMGVLLSYPEQVSNISDYFGGNLHLSALQSKIEWMLVQPAGFKPNENLAQFFGSILLNMLNSWMSISPLLDLLRA